jgi:hypothetical protein
LPDLYVGKVVDNSGELGQCKVFVPGVYPDAYESVPVMLPWCIPLMPLFAGNQGSTGVSGSPRKGALLAVMFIEGNHNKPVYVGAFQGGNSWVSEHVDQWAIASSTNKIILDDNPAAGTVTKSKGYNADCISEATPKEPDVVANYTRITTGPENVVVNGVSNRKITENEYKQTDGDRHDTVKGKRYSKADDVKDECTNYKITAVQHEINSIPKVTGYASNSFLTLDGKLVVVQDGYVVSIV